MTLSRRALLPALTLAASPSLARAATPKPGNLKDLQAAADAAMAGDGVLRLPAGSFRNGGIRIEKPLRIEGVPGLTRLLCGAGGANIVIQGAAGVSLSGLVLIGDLAPNSADNAGAAMIMAGDCDGLTISDCRFETSGVTALSVERCSGRISNNSFERIDETAIFALDSRGLEIIGNTLNRIGNNGILVWRSAAGEDGTIVANNRITKVAALKGGDGQNGNGINVFRAGNVRVSGNRITDCTFSAVRNNAGANCQITDNSISRMGEVAIYCEFGFDGAVVSGNLIEDVGLGISITNFDAGGRLAVVSNNVIRKAVGPRTLPVTSGVGIGAEADTLVTGNVIEDARDHGIHLGWMKFSRNLSACNNIIRNCGRGISFSTSDGAGPVLITGNRIAGARTAGIQGLDGNKPATDDLGKAGTTAPDGHLISGNLVS